jgi:hypothetical protein
MGEDYYDPIVLVCVALKILIKTGHAANRPYKLAFAAWFYYGRYWPKHTVLFPVRSPIEISFPKILVTKYNTNRV